MAGPPSPLSARGIRIEPEGMIVHEPQPGGAAAFAGVVGPRLGLAGYCIANPTLSATLENPGRVTSYRAFHSGPLLEPGAWRLALTIDGQGLGPYPLRTRLRGRLMVETWEAPDCWLTIRTFCDGHRNAIYQAYALTSLDGRPHALEAALRAGFLADQEAGAYDLHYDERLGAIVATLGELRLEPEPGRVTAIPARTALLGASLAPDERRISDRHAHLTFRLSAPARSEGSFCIVVAGGRARTGVERTFQEAAHAWHEAQAEAESYGQWLGSRLQLDDDSLQSLFVAGLNAAISVYREDPEHDFRGLLPGIDGPLEEERTQPADAYWCAQALLPFRPEFVRGQVLALARAVHADGRLAHSVRTRPLPEGAEPEPGAGPYDLWPDAADSPSYFAMLVHDYLCWTDDRSLLDRREGGGPSIWEKVQAAVSYLRRRDTDRDLLFEKGRTQPDWAADVLRDDWVTYDLALHCQALKSASQIALLRNEEDTARDLAGWALAAQRAIGEALWRDDPGHYVDYVRRDEGLVEDHAAIDTVVAVLYGLGTESRVHRHLEYLEQLLETRHNDRQPYGDWGVMSCYPLYRERADLVGRSASAYARHNGGAWPGWSGVYALAELLHRRPGWRYALERWWTYGLAQYWFTPTEYYAPPYDALSVRQGAALHAWSAMPAAAMILGGFGFWPNMAGETVLRVPPWGDSRLNGIRFRGASYDLEARADVLTVYHDGREVASSPRGLRIRLQPEPVITQMA